MKNLVRIALVIVAASVGVSSWAETKMAVLDYQAVLFKSLAADDATAQLRELLSGHQARLKELEQGITTRQARLKTDVDILTDEEKQQFVEEIQAFQSELGTINGQIQQAQQNSRNEFIKYYQPAIRSIVEEYVTAEQIDLVLEAQTVLWNSTVPDITQPVLDIFDQKFSDNKAKTSNE